MAEAYRSIFFRVKENVHRLLQGSSLSKVLGEGYDFSELRPYEQGDDIRNISWISSAKLGEPYVKRSYEERELNVAVALLLDGRMVIGEKRALYGDILATLGYSSLYSNHATQIAFVLNKNSNISEPTKSVEVFETLLGEFSSFELLGTKVEYENVESELLARVENRSLLFVVGDFLEEVDLSILAQKHELYILIIRDKFEEYPKVSADVQLVNPTNRRFINQTLSKKALDYYVKRLATHDKKLYEHFREHNIHYVKIYDRDSIVEKIEELFY